MNTEIKVRNRKQIEDLIHSKKMEILKLKGEIVELEHEALLLSDKEQWFTEEKETVTWRENRKKVSVEKLVGRIHWKEDFGDEDTGEVISIERSQIVRVDGLWEW